VKSDRDDVRLQEELDRLEEVKAWENATDRRTTAVTVGISVLILLMVGGFSLANYMHFKSEWTEEKFAASLNRELEYLKPSVSKQIEELGKILMPVYAEETRRQFPEVAPILADRVSEEVDKFCDEFHKEVHGKMHGTGNNLRRRIMQNIFDSYPHLKDQREQEALMGRFKQSTDQSLASAVAHFEQLFSKDIDEFQNTLYEVPDTNEPLVELQKRFIRLWIQLLDEEITKL
jgi:hypothetical protein